MVCAVVDGVIIDAVLFSHWLTSKIYSPNSLAVAVPGFEANHTLPNRSLTTP